MESNSIIKLVIIILIPVLVFFGRGYLQEFLSSNESYVVDLTPMENIDRVVNETQGGVNIVKDYSASNINYNIFNGVNPGKLTGYFLSPKPKEKEEEKEAVVVKPKRVITKPPVYNIDFVFVGGDIKYISLGNKLLEIGATTPRGEVIKNIETDRVQLQGKWGLRWVPVNY